MKLEKEIDNLKGLKKTLEEILNQVNCLEYYKVSAYMTGYIEDEIKKITSVLNTLTSMLDDKEDLLLEKDE